MNQFCWNLAQVGGICTFEDGDRLRANESRQLRPALTYVHACSLDVGWVSTAAALSKEGSGGPFSWPWPCDSREQHSLNTILHAEARWAPMLGSAFDPDSGSGPAKSPRAHCCSLGLKSLKETLPASWPQVPSCPLVPSPWFTSSESWPGLSLWPAPFWSFPFKSWAIKCPTWRSPEPQIHLHANFHRSPNPDFSPSAELF